jgi:hypothetical protein
MDRMSVTACHSVAHTTTKTARKTANGRGTNGVNKKVPVLFDMVVNVEETCPLDFGIHDTMTLLHFGEIGTVVSIEFPDQALLALAQVSTDAIRAAACLPTASSQDDSPPVAPAQQWWAPRPAIRIDAAITVTDCCPITFTIQDDCAWIIVADDKTLCLTFSRAVLPAFGLLVSEATRAMLHTRGPRP